MCFDIPYVPYQYAPMRWWPALLAVALAYALFSGYLSASRPQWNRAFVWIPLVMTLVAAETDVVGCWPHGQWSAVPLGFALYAVVAVAHDLVLRRVERAAPSTPVSTRALGGFAVLLTVGTLVRWTYAHLV